MKRLSRVALLALMLMALYGVCGFWYKQTLAKHFPLQSSYDQLYGHLRMAYLELENPNDQPHRSIQVGLWIQEARLGLTRLDTALYVRGQSIPTHRLHQQLLSLLEQSQEAAYARLNQGAWEGRQRELKEGLTALLEQLPSPHDPNWQQALGQGVGSSK